MAERLWRMRWVGQARRTISSSCESTTKTAYNNYLLFWFLPNRNLVIPRPGGAIYCITPKRKGLLPLSCPWFFAGINLTFLATNPVFSGWHSNSTCTPTFKNWQLRRSDFRTIISGPSPFSRNPNSLSRNHFFTTVFKPIPPF